MADPHIRVLVRRIASLERKALASKQPTLGFSTIDGGGAIQATDENDNLTMVVGQQFDRTHTASVVSGPPPPRPITPLVTSVAGALRVYWDGTFEGGSVAPMDFSRVLVYAEPVETYDGPDPLNQSIIVGEFNTATGGEVTASLEPNTEYVVYLVSWSQAGKFSAASGAGLGTPSNPPIPADLASAAEDIERHESWLGDLDPYAVETNVDLTAFADQTSSDLGDKQPRHDLLTTITASGVTTDHFLVGVAPNSVASFPISSFARDALASPDSASMAAALNTWDRSQIGDILAGVSPKETFYSQFVANGREARAI